jgi:hypothetical protein
MAEIHIIKVVDDLQPELAIAADVRRYFGIDGVWYEIDLTSANSDSLTDVLERYAAAARAMPADFAAPRGKPGQSDELYGMTVREYNTALRKWAEAEGRSGEITGKHNGAFYYPKPLKNDFAAYLRTARSA